jgi:hypothetical protein
MVGNGSEPQPQALRPPPIDELASKTVPDWGTQQSKPPSIDEFAPGMSPGWGTEPGFWTRSFLPIWLPFGVMCLVTVVTGLWAVFRSQSSPQRRPLADPQYVASLQRGASARRNGDYDKAIAEFNEAIRLDPRDPWAIYYRGAAWSGKGEHDKCDPTAHR